MTLATAGGGCPERRLATSVLERVSMSEATKAYCNRCGGQTNHETLASDEHEDEDGFLHLFEMLKCRRRDPQPRRRAFSCQQAWLRETRQHRRAPARSDRYDLGREVIKLGTACIGFSRL